MAGSRETSPLRLVFCLGYGQTPRFLMYNCLTMTNYRRLTAVLTLIVACSAALPLSVSAASKKAVKPKPPRLISFTGTVATIDGSVLFVAVGKKGAITLVDASTAYLTETADAPTLTFADVSTGDRVKVTGHMTPTSVVAKTLSDYSLKGRDYFYGTVTAVADDSVSFNLNGQKYNNALIEVAGAKLWRGIRKPTAIGVRSFRLREKLMVAGHMTDGVIAATGIWNLGLYGRR